MLTAQQIATNWKNGMANSTEKLRAGIQAVTEAPTQKAARRSDAYLAGVQRAVADGRWQAGLNRVTLEQWKDQMLNKGVPRVAAGAAAAQTKVADFFTQFIPHLQSGLAKLASMPRGDLDTNIARATEMMRHNAQFRMSGR